MSRNLKSYIDGALAISLAFALFQAFNASAAPPPEGSEQWNMTRPYKDFIVNMRNSSGGSCCNLSDGRANLEERYVDGHYQVRITREAYGDNPNIPVEGKWVDVPNDRILNADHANKVCEPVRARNPADNTCSPPPFNVLWISPSGHVYCYWPVPKMG